MNWDRDDDVGTTSGNLTVIFRPKRSSAGETPVVECGVA